MNEENEKLDKKIKKQKKSLMFFFISFSFITVLSIYFNNETVNNNIKPEIIYQNTLAIVYNKKKEIDNEFIMPGSTITKTFNIENHGKESIKYDLYWSCVENTFNRTGDLTYTLTSTNNGGNKTSTIFPTKTLSDVVKNVEIPKNIVQEYTLTITYIKLKNIDQSVDKDGIFNGKINVVTNGQEKKSEC